MNIVFISSQKTKKTFKATPGGSFNWRRLLLVPVTTGGSLAPETKKRWKRTQRQKASNSIKHFSISMPETTLPTLWASPFLERYFRLLFAWFFPWDVPEELHKTMFSFSLGTKLHLPLLKCNDPTGSYLQLNWNMVQSSVLQTRWPKFKC